VRLYIETPRGANLDPLMSFFAPDAVWDMSPTGMGTFEGLAAIRGFLADWLGAYEDFEMKV
jgi:ketosteroid isomerase-like protein